jgi:hypothetical protein
VRDLILVLIKQYYYLTNKKKAPALGHLLALALSTIRPNQIGELPIKKGAALVSNLKLSNNGNRASELLVNHQSKNTHHGGTAIVQLNSTLGELGLLIKGVPSKVKSSITEVTDELALSSHILHHGKLEEANKGQDLKSASNRHLERASPSLTNVRELGSVVRDVTRKTNTRAGGDLSKEGQLADTPVLQLNVTEAVESLLVGTIKESKGIEEAERRLSAELVFEGGEGGGSLAGLGWGKGGSAGDEGGNNGRLHG